MNTSQQKKLQVVIVLLIVAIVGCFIFQYASISAQNKELHTSNGLGDGHDCSAEIQRRGDKTGSWIKIDSGLTGQTFDATVSNKTGNLVSSWTLTIDITGDCYLNQFWNGTVEIHQHAGSGEEIVQTLDLADYDQDELKVDYLIDGSDLLIPLTRGDFIVYFPSKEFSEMPLDSGEETIVGMIFYYLESVDFDTYHIDYYCHREFGEGIGFIALIVFTAFLILALAAYFISERAYRQARKDWELRRQGLSCMSELYAIIYLIDLKDDTIAPIGVDEQADAIRPKRLSPNDQLKNLFQIDAKDAYKNLAFEFADLTTLPARLEKRNSLVFEYESVTYGWCRIRFIAMDRTEGEPLEKVLFTIEQIDDEKAAFNAALEQAEKAKSDTEERSILLEYVSRKLLDSSAALVESTDYIMSESTEETIRHRAKDLHDEGALLHELMENTADYFKVQAGHMAISPVEYSLKNLVLDVWQTVEPTAQIFCVNLELDIASSLPSRLRGDMNLLERIIVSLISNAIENAEGTNVKLGVFGKTVDDAKVHLLVSITASRASDTTGNPRGETPITAGQRDEETPVQADTVNLGLAKALLTLMGSKLGMASVYADGKNYYFEIEQDIIDKAPLGRIDSNALEREAR